MSNWYGQAPPPPGNWYANNAPPTPGNWYANNPPYNPAKKK
jgi:hypothetical protein